MRPLHGLRVDSRRGDHIELSVELHELGCPDELQAAQALIIINYLGDALCQGQPAPVGAPPGSGLTGTATADVIVGSAGNDAIRGGGGDDLVCAGAGNDSISAGAGQGQHLRRRRRRQRLRRPRQRPPTRTIVRCALTDGDPLRGARGDPRAPRHSAATGAHGPPEIADRGRCARGSSGESRGKETLRGRVRLACVGPRDGLDTRPAEGPKSHSGSGILAF
jgi:hypothetical protein